MRKTLYASVLVLLLCGSASAGDITNPPLVLGDINCPPSTSQSSTVQAEDDSIIHGEDSAALAEAALTVVNSVLALL